MDNLTKDQRTKTMRRVKSKDTSPEMIVRRAAHGLGYRFRLHRKDLPGKPDLVFAGRRKVIFVHGCFWHQHPVCPAAKRPASNTEYWNAKLDRNVARDKDHVAKLKKAGWGVLIIWECETKDSAALEQRLTDYLG